MRQFSPMGRIGRDHFVLHQEVLTISLKKTTGYLLAPVHPVALLQLAAMPEAPMSNPSYPDSDRPDAPRGAAGPLGGRSAVSRAGPLRATRPGASRRAPSGTAGD